jgi:hypothetical protein
LSYRLLGGKEYKMKGKVVIDFEYDEETEDCKWDLNQEGETELDKQNLIFLLEHVLSELMP